MRRLHRTHRLRAALGPLLASAWLAAMAHAAPAIETQLLAPADALSVQIEPSGRVSAVVRQGSRVAVSIDGEVGARFDRLLAADGSPMLGRQQFPALVSSDKLDHPVMFSADGRRYAYVALQGADYAVVVDGREVHRAPWQTNAVMDNPLTVQFSPKGKRYWFVASHDLPGERQGYCLFVDGKPVPIRLPSTRVVQVVFSGDESRYAVNPGRGELIIDGKLANYGGHTLQFLPNGKLLALGDGGALLDGKPLDARVRNVVVASNSRLASITADGVWLDGKIIPDTQGADTLHFSPDGKRLVIHGALPGTQLKWQWLDGKRSDTYSNFHALEWVQQRPIYARFTADSSKCVSVAHNGGLFYPLVNGAESDGYEFVKDIVVAAKGGSFGYIATTPDRGSAIVIDNTKYAKREWRSGSPISAVTVVADSLQFSPDGARSAFAVGGKEPELYLDGAPVDFGAGRNVAPWLISGYGHGDPMSVVFSPDGQRAAYVSRPKGEYLYQVVVDGAPIWERKAGIRSHPVFTPDGRHFFWMNRERAQGRSGSDEVLYANGREVMKLDYQTQPAHQLEKYKGTVVMGDDGKLRLIAVGDEGFVRHTIAPDPSYDIAAAIQAGLAAPAAEAAVAAAPAPASATRADDAKVVAAPIRVAAPAAPVEPLGWAQLVRKREAWPTTATLSREIRFSDGAVVKTGSPIAIIELKANQVVASANRGAVTFAVEPEATDALEAANAAWAALAPEARELTYASLERRPDLWPYQVKLSVPIEFSGAPSLKSGDSVLLLGYERKQLLLRMQNSNTAFNLEPENTDLLAQARGFVADPSGAPGRLLEELAGKLVDPATGRAVKADPGARPKYVVMYMGAGWCPPCKVFAPKLVATLKDAQPSPDEVSLVFLSGDKTDADAKRYLGGLGVNWPMLSFTNRGQIPAFQSLFGDAIPQLVVADRHGNVVIDSAKLGQDRALAELKKLL